MLICLAFTGANIGDYWRSKVRIAVFFSYSLVVAYVLNSYFTSSGWAQLGCLWQLEFLLPSLSVTLCRKLAQHCQVCIDSTKTNEWLSFSPQFIFPNYWEIWRFSQKLRRRQHDELGAVPRRRRPFILWLGPATGRQFAHIRRCRIKEGELVLHFFWVAFVYIGWCLHVTGIASSNQVGSKRQALPFSSAVVCFAVITRFRQNYGRWESVAYQLPLLNGWLLTVFPTGMKNASFVQELTKFVDDEDELEPEVRPLLCNCIHCVTSWF